LFLSGLLQFRNNRLGPSGVARLAASRGQLRQAREHYINAKDATLRAELKETASGWMSQAAVLEGVCQNRTEAAQTATAALSITKSFVTRNRAAMAYALAGMEAQARSLSQELLRERPDDTSQQKLYGPLVQAQLELNTSSSDPRREDSDTVGSLPRRTCQHRLWPTSQEGRIPML